MTLRWPLINLTVSASLMGSIALAFTKAMDDCFITYGASDYLAYLLSGIAFSIAAF